MTNLSVKHWPGSFCRWNATDAALVSLTGSDCRSSPRGIDVSLHQSTRRRVIHSVDAHLQSVFQGSHTNLTTFPTETTAGSTPFSRVHNVSGGLSRPEVTAKSRDWVVSPLDVPALPVWPDFVIESPASMNRSSSLNRSRALELEFVVRPRNFEADTISGWFSETNRGNTNAT